MSKYFSNIFRSFSIILSFIIIWQIRWVLFQFDSFTALYETYPSEIPTIIWKSLQIILCIGVIIIMRRKSLNFSLKEFGFHKSALVGLGIALLATSPIVIFFLIFGQLNTEFTMSYFIMTAVASPFSEEILFRGLLFGQLYKWAKWPFWAAALVNILPFAWGHLYQSDGSLLQTTGVLLIIGIGAAFFAWLYLRWEFNIWILISYHALANGWFYIFSPGNSVVSNYLSTSVVILGALCMLLITIYKQSIAEKFKINLTPKVDK